MLLEYPVTSHLRVGRPGYLDEFRFICYETASERNGRRAEKAGLRNDDDVMEVVIGSPD